MILRYAALAALLIASVAQAEPAEFFNKHCVECHGPETKEAGLDLTALPAVGEPDAFSRWVKVFDRVSAGEMPPNEAPQPTAEARKTLLEELSRSLIAAEQRRDGGATRRGLRRLTRAEYENTVRDLFDMPGIAVQSDLPPDGSAHGFDKTSDALDISHVNLAKYMAAAEHTLALAIATRPRPPKTETRRLTLAYPAGFVAHVMMHGDGVQLKNQQHDPDFPPAGVSSHIDQGAHERMGCFRNGATVGLFRHEDEAFHPYFNEFVAIYPGRYRIKTSLWSFQWEKGQVLPSRGIEAARLSIVQLTGDGRGGGHPSSVLTYFDAPSLKPATHEIEVWLNTRETLGFNAASLVSGHTRGENRAMGYSGPGIACDWLDVEGPLFDRWPPISHLRLFGDLPIQEFQPAQTPNVRPPRRQPDVQTMFMGRNKSDPIPGIWTVHSDAPLIDAERLLAEFLPRAFRRPVDRETLAAYLRRFEERMQAGDCFETAMRSVYRAALCSPDFLYHVEPGGPLDDFALACRLSYFLWNSLPDEPLFERVAAGRLHEPDVLRGETERLLRDPRSQRFVDDFLGQWLKLRQIAANDPDKKLYPEFRPYLQDSMVAETKAYFRELLDKNLDAGFLVRSNFAMLNEKLAVHYGIPSVRGSQIRRVELPAGCPRGGFLTQGAILKITANGTTTSPVPRGAFVMDRLLGEPPEPPPANVSAIEPDVRGATTIREQLAKHRADPVCASCHSRIDPPGFALESFDVIGGFRDRYRSIGDGDPAQRGAIDPFIPLSFKLGPAVDASGVLPDGRKFQNVQEYQALLAGSPEKLLRNLARQLAIYAIGRNMRFSDRPAIDDIVRRTQDQGGGLRTLIYELVKSPLFSDGPLRAFEMAAEFPLRSDWLNGPPSQPATAAIASSAVETAEASKSADGWPTVRVRVTGIYAPRRADFFQQAMTPSNDARLIHLDGETCEAEFAYDPRCDRFRGVKAEELPERLDQAVRNLTSHTFGVKPMSSLPREKLERVEIPLIGLDCQACCLAVYEIVTKIEGVEHATASYADGKAVAWIDPSRTDREAIIKLLEQREVQIAEQ